MPEIDLTQSEADALMAMEKRRADSHEHDFPDLGGAVSIPLISPDRRENFLLDLSRGRIDLAKVRFQNRARQVVVLVRLDLSGAVHRNPDGREVWCPHLHLYREGFGDKWAFPVPPEAFPDLGDIWSTLGNFMRYCNITEPPAVRRGLFT